MSTSIKLYKLFKIISLLLIILSAIRCERNAGEQLNPPVVQVAVAPETGLTTTAFVFDCSTSQPGNKKDNLFFRWDWNSDGKWDTEYSADQVYSHRFLSKGILHPVVQALNSSGLTDSVILTVTIGQGFSPPRALYQVIPASGNRLTEFTFDATPTRDDEDSLGQLQFRWDWEGDGRWDNGFNPAATVKHVYYETGDFQPLMEVKDRSGMTGQYRSQLEVTRVNPRLLVHFSWIPLHPLQTDTVVFDAGLSKNLDNPDDALQYYWKFETGEPLKAGGWLGPYDEPVITHTFSMEYEYLVTLRVVDGLGLENQIARTIVIFHKNRPPVPRFKVSTTAGNLTTQFLLNAWNTNDAEDLPSALRVRWDFESDNRWDTEYTGEKIVYHRFDLPGIYKILLEAQDTKGLTDTTSLFVRVTTGTNETGLIIDRRFDGEEYYPTVRIGNQWWMARNMYFEPYVLSSKIDTLRSVCYGGNEFPPGNVAKECDKWGRLYTAYSASNMNLSERAQGICPAGWHLPTKEEWETLITTIGGYSAAKELLPGGSTDFNALYAGWGEEVMTSEGWGMFKEWRFNGFGSITYFWSSTPLGGWPVAVSHWNVALVKGQNEISTGYSGNANFLSVRCIKND
jgi:uncharacterized protein (TIGR02145 family)